MARTMSSTAVGQVNRRFLFLALILASLSAVLVYAAVSRSDSGEKLTPAGDVSVVVAKVPIPAGTRITTEMLQVRKVPEAAVGAQAAGNIEAVVGEVARYPIALNEQLLLSKMVGGQEVSANNVLSNILEEGTRGLAIGTQAVIGAGGLVLPGDHVDVLWLPDEVLEDHADAMLIAENVEVLAVQQTLVDVVPSAPGLQEEGEGEEAAPSAAGDERVRGFDEEAIPDANTVTLMLTLDQARLVFCAESSGSLRLAVRAFGDNSPSGLAPATCMLLAEEERG